MAAPSGQLRVGPYFLALLAITAILYALVFFTGTTRTPKLGLDLQGGNTVTLQAVTTNGKAPSATQLNEAKRIIENRVNGRGVAEAEVVTQGKDQIVVSAPGSKEDLRDIGGVAQLRFRQVLQVGAGTAAPPPSPAASPSPAAKSPAASPSAAGRALTSALLAPTPTPTPKASSSAAPGATPTPSASPLPGTGTEIGQLLAKQPAEALFSNPQVTCQLLSQRPDGATDDVKKKQVACDTAGAAKYLLDVAKVQGTDVGSASYEANTDSPGSWKVILNFKGKGQSKWTALTREAFGKTSPNDQVAIVLDGKVVSAPSIKGVITGNAEITGTFTRTEAELLANQLKYGALPLTMTATTAQSVSPTLGTDQLKAALLAGGIGLVLVVIYSLLYYRALGLVTVASLVLSGTVTYACLVLLGRGIGFTLTLGGIAGFIVAVGITADSFIVFFERLKDEVKDGRSVRSAVPRAWMRARRTILSANAVTFLAAAALYTFSIGAVRGFAFTLGLSTLLDLLIVFLFTHPLLSVLSRFRGFDSPRITGLGNVRHREPALAGAGGIAPAMTKES
ncbi:MAG: protein translocase subunit SecD [Mycobacteriales bacterium]